MADTVLVPIPVAPAAADALRDEGLRQQMGQIVSDLVEAQGADPLVAAFDTIAAAAAAAGFTEADLQAELAAHKTERTR